MAFYNLTNPKKLTNTDKATEYVINLEQIVSISLEPAYDYPGSHTDLTIILTNGSNIILEYSGEKEARAVLTDISKHLTIRNGGSGGTHFGS
ncbi:MAG: hypothetical protein EOO61_12410 [Hymenobacter sp.]|nr:MAG: hypothetical protein EOO61_12410 [Hymenobacter sp.]